MTVPDTYTAPDDEARQAVRALLPLGVADALDRTCDRLVQAASTLYAGGGPRGTVERPRPVVRVAEAVASMNGVAERS